MRKRPPCQCARCRGVKTADRRWGFDRAKVPKMECLYCDLPIGRRRWVAVTILARFGDMMFAHAKCERANA